MEINDELINKLEHLSKLSLSEAEREIMKKDLGNILQMVDKIQEVDTSNVEPLMHVNEDVNVLREDVARNEITNEEALRNAPSSSAPYISVPKVIDIK
ncbi:Asp-tRNA(Asn)/Glu-tRNA(Gln) amidotransferase subunit GatC [Portibacter lacus]|uniref:Aspartyl/glutamyl-tRNA(Asn/Gln) amidotransferase subunit C n=2 Tax=Portibacter lacus TaxID=1099794 RepID=A0AA37SLA8_9BACT|nr:Asp-tRNA(Asn)/Glu-tRNA(Gln) amidotransferase subunit GatC [Portibacter lacus]GLR16246.1 aspartyl/glutamyl-tRNA(Asn/Gln) amidotransferase subunit C [Portibacter lacus]